MDPLTNSLAAFTLGRTGLRRWAPRGGLLLILSANLPDIDLLSVPFSPLYLVSFVGGPLHSLAAAPLLAAAVATVFRLAQRERGKWVGAFGLALAGLLLRLLLDTLGVHGVQLFYPFSQDWIRFDALPWFDPWLCLLLLAYAFWPLISYLVNVEMGIRESAGQSLAFVALLLAAGYCGYRAANTAEAKSVVANHNYGGEAPLREVCIPYTFSLARIRCVVETDTQFADIDYFPGDYFDATEAQMLKRQNRPSWQVAQFQSLYFQRIERRLRMPYWTVYPADYPPAGTEVNMRDLVLAPEPYPLFRLRLLLTSQEALAEETLTVQWEDAWQSQAIRDAGIMPPATAP